MDELTDTIRELVNDPALRNLLGDDARRTATRHFDIARVASALHEQLFATGSSSAIEPSYRMESAE
jgi:hypothetical protein